MRLLAALELGLLTYMVAAGVLLVHHWVTVFLALVAAVELVGRVKLLLMVLAAAVLVELDQVLTAAALAVLLIVFLLALEGHQQIYFQTH